MSCEAQLFTTQYLGENLNLKNNHVKLSIEGYIEYSIHHS